MNRDVMALSLVLVLSALLSGCVTAKPMYTSAGQTGIAITCSGHRNSWGDCLAEAGAKCQKQGYTVLDRNGEAVPVEFHQFSSDTQINSKGLFRYTENNETSSTGFHGVAEHRSMVVMCGHPAPPHTP